MPKRWMYIVAYDTPSNSRRAIMLERAQGFGLDPQLSFHECQLTVGERRELWREFHALADPLEDKVLLLRLDPRSLRWRLGKTEPATPSTLTYIG